MTPTTNGTARPDGSRSRPVPAPLRWTRVCLALLIVILLALPVVMTLDPDPYIDAIARENPSLDDGELRFAYTLALAMTYGVHVPFAAVLWWLVVKTLRGRRWARVVLTLALAVAILHGFVSAAAGPEYYPAVIAGDVVMVAMIALIWIPASVRAFFAAPPR
ncbi:hypothetical protein CLV63_102175 [Murinocardiopsis flavida]|uniref:Uncharacterized protein n=1 Tax=Murinocardiopsis flavida TaxID=645275 RepID=A0A2P8DS52_9ACTN|nr:hypothetical protein [Murinocardiopsis flavida]PSL00049.1 hypothetical protein CLV63_102175 [Murinocardiopsis flavida]